ncbi:MAG TPA: D-alanyl-D-alanine carboxypeptidase family protein [Rhizobiaceae bacterium]|nr:D-alanyl-D-alanine carboxypeptidase family protein [Rhizobiaceae bacterium]
MRVFACVGAYLALTVSAGAQLFETKATQAYMIDATTGTVLFSKDPDKPIPPASLAKLMTMELVFHGLKTGRLSMDDTFIVSENAWRTGGAPSGTSTMFAALKSEIRIEDLIQGVVVQSANDGCIIIAEGMSGTEEIFAQQMTDRARALGFEKLTFKNSTGLPADGQVVTVRELARLGEHIWKTYPEYFKYYSQPEFTWNKITQKNRNPLLSMGIGADGMKTGFTEESGYAIVGSAARDGRRIFVALGGMTSERERAEEARKIIEWGMKAFEKNELFADGETVGEAQVYGGEKGGVALKAKGPISILIPLANRDRLIARIVYEGPVVAPVEEGTPVGSLKVWIGDTLSQETPLFAAESVGVGTLWQRAQDAVFELLTGWLRTV